MKPKITEAQAEELTERHTKEPWGSDDQMIYQKLEDGMIAIAYTKRKTADHVFGQAEANANAKRIVASVNACTGMADPEAEIARLRKEFLLPETCGEIERAADLIYEIAQLRQDKAELLETVEEISKGEGAYNYDPLIHAANTVDSMKAIAKAAIAKAGKEL